MIFNIVFGIWLLMFFCSVKVHVKEPNNGSLKVVLVEITVLTIMAIISKFV